MIRPPVRWPTAHLDDHLVTAAEDRATGDVVVPHVGSGPLTPAQYHRARVRIALEQLAQLVEDTACRVQRQRGDTSMPMVPLPIHSSALASAAYDYATGELLVQFQDGSQYVYDVDPLTVAAFVAAGSQGRYFNEVIRPRGGTPA